MQSRRLRSSILRIDFLLSWNVGLSSVLVGIFNNNEERCIFSLLNSTTQVAFVGGRVLMCGVLLHWVLNISIRSLQLMDESCCI
jgi:hypothetical protein